MHTTSPSVLVVRRLVAAAPLLLGAVCATACGRAIPSPAGAAGATASPPAASTPAPASANEIADRDTEALVAELARQPRVADERVGYGGEPSAEFAVYARVAAAATLDEMVALTRHPSPVVRGYAAWHVAEGHRERLADVRHVFTDATPVETQYGCFTTTMTVAHVAANALCSHSAEPDARSILAEVARGAEPGAARTATQCLARP